MSGPGAAPEPCACRTFRRRGPVETTIDLAALSGRFRERPFNRMKERFA
jgi:hypothetical protein